MEASIAEHGRTDILTRILTARKHSGGQLAVLDLLLEGERDPQLLLREVWERAQTALLLDDMPASAATIGLSAELAQAVQSFVIRVGQEDMLAMQDPWNDEQLHAARVALGQELLPVGVTSARLDAWLRPPEAAGEDAQTDGAQTDGATATATEQGAVVRFVDEAVVSAYRAGASDIHFECDRSGVTVKLRQDGVMVSLARMQGQLAAEEVISRIKVMAKLDITERRKPQDGRFRTTLGQQPVDMRVSIMPSVVGEDAVLRLLDKAQLRASQSTVSLDLLGFDQASVERLRGLGHLPHGMLLITGPTGSGKTTTVYGSLSEVNTGLEKIITIEDPVEYELPGVLQIPVNEKKGLTFALGLRSILRHDPDRILVGEIRDSETAEIAVQSALTGHQVFTTVHANSLFDVMGRFRHFGLDMFSFMAALNGVIVQRLVRKVCAHCVETVEAEPNEKEWLSGQGVHCEHVPRAKGCVECRNTGYRGRKVIAEVHAMDDTFRDLVTGNAPVSALRAHVALSSVLSLAKQGALMVARGETTAQEIRRVVGW